MLVRKGKQGIPITFSPLVRAAPKTPVPHVPPVPPFLQERDMDIEYLTEDEARRAALDMCEAYESSYKTFRGGLDTICKKHLGQLPRGYDEETGKGMCYDTAFWLLLLGAAEGVELLLCHGEVFHPDAGWHGHAWVMSGDGLWCADYANGNEAILPTDAYVAVAKSKNVRTYDLEQARALALDLETTGPWDEQ